MKLFILGNGFDLAHGIKSKYSDFGEYLEIKYPNFYIKLMAAISNDQGIWSDFEGRLPMCGFEMESKGMCAAQERLEELDYDPMSDEGMYDWMKEQMNFIDSLPKVLRMWVESIDINKLKVYKDNLFSNQDLFLTFNYTDTLEKLYGIPKENILHIHGDVEKTNHDLIMGHGDYKQIEYVQKNLEKSEEEYNDYAVSIYKCVLEFLQKTYKQTSLLISKNEGFFELLSNVDEIIVIGSSLSNADYPYFDYIKKIKDYKWTMIYYYSDDQKKVEQEKEKTIKFMNELGVLDSDFTVIPSKAVLL